MDENIEIRDEKRPPLKMCKVVSARCFARNNGEAYQILGPKGEIKQIYGKCTLYNDGVCPHRIFGSPWTPFIREVRI
ncbi:hypothetical protein KAR91_38680 [Candidatus Pacearchaeota archaeon]|nr:hypothetical protein [Candidatus Pacearchaeota archaeon]